MAEKWNSEAARRKVRPLSPCVLICTLDEHDICVGCGRTLQQISRWALMSKDEQWAVVDDLARRAGPG